LALVTCPRVLPAPFDAFATTFLVLFGMLVGSFLNVVVWRVPRGESIVFPGSHCPRCGAPIAGYDNIPVLSWLLLGGRCRTCRGPISLRYPLVEALAGLLTWLFVHHDGFTWLLPFHLAFAYGGLALALIDLDTFLLPLSITLPLIPISIASGYFEPERGWLRALIGAAVGWALIVLVGKIGELLAGREAMGGGDAWLMASIGGFTGPFRLLLALFFASVQGTVIGLYLIRARRKRQAALPPPSEAPEAEGEPAGDADDEEEWQPDPTAVPFGPFLVLGAFETLLWGEQLISALHLNLLAAFR